MFVLIPFLKYEFLDNVGIIMQALLNVGLTIGVCGVSRQCWDHCASVTECWPDHWCVCSFLIMLGSSCKHY